MSVTGHPSSPEERVQLSARARAAGACYDIVVQRGVVVWVAADDGSCQQHIMACHAAVELEPLLAAMR